jgi:hypothetical protein
MFVDPLRRIGQAGPARKADAAAPGFQAPDDGAPAASARPTALATAMTGLDAILALQAEPAPVGRRGRQLARGKKSIDALEQLQRALVLGAGKADARAALMSVDGEFEPTGDVGLDSLLLEIETRRAVELAKLDRG